MDPPGHGELEPAQAGHHQVNHEAGQGGGEQLTQHSEVIVTGPAWVNVVNVYFLLPEPELQVLMS